MKLKIGCNETYMWTRNPSPNRIQAGIKTGIKARVKGGIKAGIKDGSSVWVWHADDRPTSGQSDRRTVGPARRTVGHSKSLSRLMTSLEPTTNRDRYMAAQVACEWVRTVMQWASQELDTGIDAKVAMIIIDKGAKMWPTDRLSDRQLIESRSMRLKRWRNDLYFQV